MQAEPKAYTPVAWRCPDWKPDRSCRTAVETCRVIAAVFRQAWLWGQLEQLCALEFTFPGKPMRIDYGYRRTGTRGFVQTLFVSGSPADDKLLAYTAHKNKLDLRLADHRSDRCRTLTG